ncbi:MAG: hypothetical protein WC467_00650 [Patescibacteria group bacterium]
MSNKIETLNMETQIMEKETLTKQEEQIQKGWEASRLNEVVKRLKANENLQEIMNSLPGFREAFTDLDTIDCSDGRVLSGKKIGIAGSGLLLSPEERLLFIERFKGKIKEVTTHRDCGAAAIKFADLKTKSPDLIPAGLETSDEYGTYTGQKIAEELGAKHRFLDMPEMASEYHNETAIVLDATARFDSTNLEKFPAHFVCTGAGLGFSREYMKSELETLAGIALGHHGFGKERFSTNDPFYIIVVGKDSSEMAAWENAATEVAAKFEGRVAVKGFVSPETME